MEGSGLLEKNYSGFWRRAAALMIDILIVGTLNGVLAVGDPKSLSNFQSLLAVVGGFITIFYGVLMECSEKQATVGKLILGIRVTDLNGNKISFLRSVVRQFSKVFSVLLLGLGFLLPLFTKKKQALHDLIAECVVIKHKIHY